MGRVFPNGEMELDERSKTDVEASVHNDELRDRPSRGLSDEKVFRGGLDVRKGCDLWLLHETEHCAAIYHLHPNSRIWRNTASIMAICGSNISGWLVQRRASMLPKIILA